MVFGVGAGSKLELGELGIGLQHRVDRMVVGEIDPGYMEHRSQQVDLVVELDYIDIGFVAVGLGRFGLVGGCRVDWGFRMG